MIAINPVEKVTTNSNSIEQHIELILSHNLVKINKIKSSKLKVVVDGINSTEELQFLVY